MTPPCQFCKPHEAQGAARERRRIRRAQREPLAELYGVRDGLPFESEARTRLTIYLRTLHDTTTRASRRKR